ERTSAACSWSPPLRVGELIVGRRASRRGSEECGTGSLRGWWQQPEAYTEEAGVLQPPGDLRGREAEPDVSHPLLVLVAVVLEHVDHEDAAAGKEHARRLAQHRPRVGDVV